MPAAVFASKLLFLVRALKAADKALNGKPRHDYRISKLSSSNPTAVLSEIDLLSIMHPYGIRDREWPSAIEGFEDCANAILANDRARALRYGNCAKNIAKLAQGSLHNFSYAEVWTANDNIVRVDDLLVHQAHAMISVEARDAVFEESRSSWFKGTAFGTFDGMILEVDLRGALPAVKLVLSVGDQQIDCVCKVEDIEKIRTALKRRARVYGNAFYDGHSGLPKRINVTDIEPIPSGGDLSIWANSFEAYDPPDWEEDVSE